MQTWGDVLLTVDAYQDFVRRIEKRQARKGDHWIYGARSSKSVIRLIKRLR